MLVELVTLLRPFICCGISILNVYGYALAKALEECWIHPFTAGRLIYIATVAIIPELCLDSPFWYNAREMFGLLLGIFSNYLLCQHI
ncbi:ZIP zinc transporter domain-containing protein [Ditylenchus destructor]|uniref:ZIP zinc transporter domain-containing protein n=1 Tax=Ditylenchus destructor TaxID=166010 RepID=A0AAD4R2H6_9BILA|nr:ZIP zinc transporter domain-containing protein [Ditylenchus destructor]